LQTTKKIKIVRIGVQEMGGKDIPKIFPNITWHDSSPVVIRCGRCKRTESCTFDYTLRNFAVPLPSHCIELFAVQTVVLHAVT